jgi:DNA polymerase-1
MYEGIVASGAVPTRDQAKVAMLGAMYGATTGESGRLMPALTRAFPRAIALVEQAARAGELGQVVSTRLGRSSPAPSAAWRTVQGEGSLDEAADRRARSQSRGWGRFTRNFIVQGTAAEWALCWMGSLRRRLWELGGGDDGSDALTDRPHLVFFLHDELIVHTPLKHAERVDVALRESAAEAGRLLFGAAPVEFAITVATVRSYDQAK